MSTRILIPAALVTALVVTGCGSRPSPATNPTTAPPAATTKVAAGPATTVAPVTTVVPTAQPGDVLFEDAFEDDRNGWGIVDHPQYGSTEYVDGDYLWAFRGRVAHWLPGVLGAKYDSGQLQMLDVVVEAQATVNAGGGVVGVFCRETPDTDADFQWYEFVVRDGFGAIRIADLEGNIEALTQTEDLSLPSGETFQIRASCVDTAGGVDLRLALNGNEVLQTMHGEPLGNGVTGLQAYTFPEGEQMDIIWHDFSVKQA